MVHKLKIRKEYADEIVWGNKTFELRKNDRDYKQGDTVEFTVVDKDQAFSKPYPTHPIENLSYEITYVLENVPEYGLKEGYCIFGIRNNADWRKVDEATKEISRQVAHLRELVVSNIEKAREL